MAAISLEGISRHIGDRLILADIDLDIRDREFFCVIGPSGCGKTSLLRLVAGLDFPSAGAIRFDGEDVTRLSAQKRDIAMVFQSYALYPHMRARGNIGFPLTLTRLHRTEVDRRVIQTAENLGAGLVSLLEQRPSDLAMGQRQRVAIGRAVIRHPRVYLFDEPLTNLDARLRAITRVEFKKLIREFGRTVVYVTPDRNEAFALGDRIAVMRTGRIEQVNTSTGLWARPASVFVADFVHQEGFNLYRVQLDPEARVVEGPDFRVPAVPSIIAKSRQRTDLYIGILPDHVKLELPSEESTVVARVEVVETLLQERRRKVHLARGGFRCIASVPLGAGPSVDDWFGIRFDLEEALLFDAHTEQSLI
ncbi:MAG: ABC transporter ATP-binding protein [Chloroflexi bacterium]|nr:ABC transporter ATP-binding protein [Chloroflexota bacterium]